MKAAAVIILLGIFSITGHATHLKGGYIRIESTGGLTYRIIIEAFMTGNALWLGGDDSVLDFGDGTSVTVPEQNTVIQGPFYIARYETIHTYSSSGKYTVSYKEPNRDEGIVNIQSSVNTIFYIESAFTADALIAYESPRLLSIPIFTMSAGDYYSFSLNAVDPNQHDLFFAFASPKEVTDYRMPETATVHSKTGLMEWDSQFQGQFTTGEFLFNIKIKQIKDDIELGYLTLDFGVTVTPGSDQLVFNNDSDDEYFIVEEGNRRSWKAIAFEADGDQFPTISMTTNVPDDVTFETYDSVANGKNLTVARVDFFQSSSMPEGEPCLITLRARVDSPTIMQRDILIAIFSEEPSVITSSNEVVTVSDEQAIIFPNPFKDHLQVSTPRGRDARIVLRSVDNRVYYDGPASALSYFDVEAAPSILIYQILTGNKVFTGRLVRE